MKIVSLNIRKWSRDRNPFDWNHWWIVRTWRQRKFFKKENPDVICLQEKWFPVGKLLLGLWKYKCYGGWKCHIPIYIKKDLDNHWYWDAKFDNNGHGTLSIMVNSNSMFNQDVLITNCHFPWQEPKFKECMDKVFPTLENEIVCGDFNCGRNRINKLIPQINFIKEQESDTFQNYKHPEQHGEIDYFLIPDDFTLSVVSQRTLDTYKLSDHKPIKCLLF